MSIANAPEQIEAGIDRFRRIQTRRLAIVATLVGAAIAAFLVDIATGPSPLRLDDAIGALVAPGEGSGEATFIMWHLRLPQGLLAILIGFSLGLAGVEMQTILDNSLADPFTLGVSAAAALGAALAIVLGISIPGIPDGWIVSGNAFVFALGSLLIMMSFARANANGSERIILFGIAMGFSFGALLALLQFVASPDALQQLTFWSMGSLTRANWEVIPVMALMAGVTLVLSARDCWKLNALGFGEDSARVLGIDVGRLRLLVLLRISLLAAISVSFAGIIGLIGLTGPHIARLLVGNDHRFLMPASALIAMIVMSLAAVLSKSLLPGIVIPIGIVTALIGLPVFFSLLVGRREVA